MLAVFAKPPPPGMQPILAAEAGQNGAYMSWKDRARDLVLGVSSVGSSGLIFLNVVMLLLVVLGAGNVLRKSHAVERGYQELGSMEAGTQSR